MNKNFEKSIKNGVIEKIKEKKVKMKPKSHFIIEGLIFALVLIFVLFLSIFFVGFILFVLKIAGFWFLPQFGILGLKTFFISFPWTLFLIGSLLIFVLAILFQRFEFSWQRPVIYSFFLIFIIVIFAGIVSAKTPFHETLLQNAIKGKLPIAGTLYKKYSLVTPKNTHFCTVTEIKEGVVKLQTPEGQELRINLPQTEKFQVKEIIRELETKESVSGTSIPQESGEFEVQKLEETEQYAKDSFGVQVSDSVIIIGEKEDSQIKAFRIRKVQKDSPLLKFLQRPK